MKRNHFLLFVIHTFILFAKVEASTVFNDIIMLDLDASPINITINPNISNYSYIAVSVSEKDVPIIIDLFVKSSGLPKNITIYADYSKTLKNSTPNATQSKTSVYFAGNTHKPTAWFWVYETIQEFLYFGIRSDTGGTFSVVAKRRAISWRNTWEIIVSLIGGFLAIILILWIIKCFCPCFSRYTSNCYDAITNKCKRRRSSRRYNIDHENPQPTSRRTLTLSYNQRGELQITTISPTDLINSINVIQSRKGKQRTNVTQDIPEELICVICLTAKKSIAFKPCDHVCCCPECAKKLIEMQGKCPLCRSVITGVLESVL